MSDDKTGDGFGRQAVGRLVRVLINGMNPEFRTAEAAKSFAEVETRDV